MSFTTFSRVAAVAAGVFASASAFDASSKSNVAMYWGQGAYQIPLAEVCSNPSIDIVQLAFIDIFPTYIGDYPGSNFANACGDEMYTTPGGNATGLRSNCPTIGPGITACQQAGKKVLLSIGGGYPIDYVLPTTDLAKYFAEFLWGAFGPTGSSAPQSWVDAGSPRPFGDAVIDGFDFDIESYQANPPYADYQYRGYADMINHFRDILFPTASGTYYISGAPQCVVPDAHLDDSIQNSVYDFLFVQFYNTPQCSARAGVNGLNSATTAFTFDQWVTQVKTYSKNKDVKIYLGLPAGTAGAPYDTASYLNTTEANDLLSTYLLKYPGTFGGAMLWEATVSSKNTICNNDYAWWIKKILTGAVAGTKFDSSSCPSSTSSSSTAASTTATPSATGGVSKNGMCGTNNGGTTCKGSTYGDCCSTFGYCGSSTDFCVTYCDPVFGNCGLPSSTFTSSTVTPTPTGGVSKNGMCGADNGGTTCKGSTYGDCCSTFGYCGSTEGHCVSYCDPIYGLCGIQSSSSSSMSSTTSSSAILSSSTQLSSGSSVISSSIVSSSSSAVISSTAVSSSSSSMTSSSSSSSVSSTGVPSSSLTIVSSTTISSSSSSLSSSIIVSSSSLSGVSSSAVSASSSPFASSTLLSTSSSSLVSSSSASSTAVPSLSSSSVSSSTPLSSSVASVSSVVASSSTSIVATSSVSTSTFSSASSSRIASSSSSSASSSQSMPLSLSSVPQSSSLSSIQASSTQLPSSSIVLASSSKAASSSTGVSSSARMSSITQESSSTQSALTSTSGHRSSTSTYTVSSSLAFSSESCTVSATLYTPTPINTISSSISQSSSAAVPSSSCTESTSMTTSSAGSRSITVSSVESSSPSSVTHTPYVSSSVVSPESSRIVSSSAELSSTQSPSTTCTESFQASTHASESSHVISGSTVSTVVLGSLHTPYPSSFMVYPGSSAVESSSVIPSSSSCTDNTAHGSTMVGSSMSGHFPASSSYVPSTKTAGVSTSILSRKPYPSSIVTGKPSLPSSSSGPSGVITTIITTSYVDICPTGFTTIVTTITTTVCPETEKPVSTSSGILPGWTTTVTVCDHCGPKLTTVTLTKPIQEKTTTSAVSETTTVYSTRVHTVVMTNEIHSSSTAPIESSMGQVQYPSQPAQNPSVPAMQSSVAPVKSTSVIVHVVTMTKVPIPYSMINGTGSVGPTGYVASTASTGTWSATNVSPYSTATPSQFEGGASKVGMGVSAVAVLVAALLVL